MKCCPSGLGNHGLSTEIHKNIYDFGQFKKSGGEINFETLQLFLSVCFN